LDKIRVTYSGLVSFGISLISIITGLFFTIIITRQLSIEEFGTWGIINGLLIYPVMIIPTITYWVTRETARNQESAITAIMSSGILSIFGILTYIGIALVVGSQSEVEFSILLLAVILVPVVFLDNTLSAINVGHRPQAAAYGVISFELIKIPIGLFFIYFLNFGIEGAIIAVFIAYIGKIIILGILSRKRLRGKFQKKYLKKWFKLFWLPTYRNFPSLIAMSDVLIFSIITGSVVGVAYYTSARTIGTFVLHVRAFSTGLYPKLLETEKHEFLQENLIKFFYFAIPLTAFSIIFAKPGLFVLNPIYIDASPFVLLISIRMFLITLNKMLFQALTGIENIDKMPDTNFRDYLKSKLFWVPTVDIIRHVVFIAILASILIIFASESYSDLELVNFWVLISLGVEIPLTFYIMRLVRKSFKFKIDLKSLFKYLLTSIVIFGIIGIIMEESLEYKESIFEFLPSVIPYAIIAILLYLATTYLIDKRTKILVKGIISEFRKTKNK
jgi:hypothetical protein